MGHQRLGDIPKSRKWKAVVAAVSGGGGGTTGSGDFNDYVSDVARQALDAAGPGLQRAIGDSGLSYTFFLLTQIVLAARKEDWRDRLRQTGIRLTDKSDFFDLTSEIQRAVDEFVVRQGRRTDVGEIAQQAAGEALVSLAGQSARTLFGTGSAEVQDAVRQLSTTSGFGRLGQRFFGCFLTRFLNFYISRLTAASTGSRSLKGVGAVAHFNETLERHCEQSAAIVRDFCGQWYSKTEFQTGINLENSTRCVAHALTKLQDELAQQRTGT